MSALMALPEESSEQELRVLIQGSVGVSMTKALLGSLSAVVAPAAIVSTHQNHATSKPKRFLIVGQRALRLEPVMTVFPGIAEEYQGLDIRILRADGSEEMVLNIQDEADYKRWLRAIRCSIADAAFQDVFTAPLQLSKIEQAVQHCSHLVPSAYCHMRRASNLIRSLQALDRIQYVLYTNITEDLLLSLREDIQHVVKASESEHLLHSCIDIGLLKSLANSVHGDSEPVLDALLETVASTILVPEVTVPVDAKHHTDPSCKACEDRLSGMLPCFYPTECAFIEL